MFFNVKGIKLTVLALMGALVLCLLDLHCSGGGNEDEAVDSSIMTRVKGEVAAGKRAYAAIRAEQLEEQLRSLRVTAKKLVRDGKETDARRVILTIQEMEKELERLYEKEDLQNR